MRSEGFSSFRFAAVTAPFILLFFAAVTAQQPQGGADLMHLSWEKDFELILEINKVPTKGQVSARKELEALLAEKEELEKKKAALEKRLESFSTVIYTDKLYDEALAEGTTDVASTKESIARKLADVTEKLEDVDTRLRRMRR